MVQSARATAAGSGAMGIAPLLEREQELACFDDVLRRIGDGVSAVIIVEGPAGIGKSRLVDALSAGAERDGIPVLSARCAHLERDFAFGVVRQLFETMLADPSERERLLEGAAAPAAAVFDGVATPSAAPGDGSFAALHGLYWLTVSLADGRPLVLVVDDLQWCDAPSLRYLAYIARRLSGAGIVLALTLRTGRA